MPDLEHLLINQRRVRTIGIDDGPFKRGQRKDVLVVGTVCANTRFEGLLTTRVRPDGFNATDRLIRMVGESKFYDQVHAGLIDGVTLGGFNVVDIARLSQALKRPVISVMRRRPDLEAVFRVMERLTHSARRRRLIDAAGPVLEGDQVFFQVQGAAPGVAAHLLRSVTDRGHIPEPLRLAHLIGSGVVTGESGRRA